MTTKDLPELVSTKGAAEIVGVCKSHLIDMRADGRFPVEPAWIGGMPVWTRGDVEEFARDRLAKSG